MSESKKIYFNAGPTKIPEEVLLKAQSELLNFDDSGISILETSHRSEQYKKLNQKAQNSLRQILSIPDDYEVLFLQGGATGIFSAIPLNMTDCDKCHADYIVTGTWSSKAFKEAKNYLSANLALPNGECCVGVPDPSSWKLNEKSQYLYYCDNETVHGVEFAFVPETGNVPIVCDMSSNILTRPVDVSKFDVLFAGAQKNMGCAGVTVVVIKKQLLGKQRKECPSILNFKSNADASSILNTPPTFSIYILSLVLDWVIENGGVKEMERRCLVKSKLIYDVIDQSNEFYWCPVEEISRSRVNISFRIGGRKGDVEVEKAFLAEAKDNGFYGLQGHRSVGGIRVCLYNAITIEETEKLASFMKSFLKSRQSCS